MTLKQTAKYLRQVSNGWINGKKYTYKELVEDMTEWMDGKETYIGKVTLADGEWTLLISRFPLDRNQFDFYIPDTRKHEAEFLRTFTA